MSSAAGGDISVVITYYNREQYIDEAIQSVLAQTLQPLEIIVVNDGSRESARKYLDRYADVCTIVDMPTNQGTAAARNEGIRKARGQYVAFLDDDDMWLPEKMERQLRYMVEHPHCDGVHGAAWAFSSNQPDRLYDRDWTGPLTLAQALTREGAVMTPTLLIRAEVLRSLGGNDPRFRRVQDRDFAIRCAAAGCRIESMSEPLTRIRRQAHDRATRHNGQMLRSEIRLCWKHRALYYRVYGVRGIVSFLCDSLRMWTRNVIYLGGAVRLLLRLMPVKWQVKTGYEEPVQCEV